MSLDIAHQLGALKRRAERRSWNGKSCVAVIAERVYPTNQANLWDAITTPDRISRWFMPVSGDLQLGGRYQLEGNAGGQVDACDAPRHFEVTWEHGGGKSWVWVTLVPESESTTRLILEHISPEDDKFKSFWDQYGPGAVGVGWELGLFGLSEYIRTNQSHEAKGSHDWTLSGDGKAYAIGSSAGWTEANIAFGTTEDAAQAAGRRTTAFYTGSNDGV
jgi:uncharacterized protein YndB with AHSA1/START domain